MARGFIKIFRTYNYIDKNPVIDKVRTLMQDEGLYDRLAVAAEISNVGRGTMANWFTGPTRNPQHHTIMAVVSSMGYEEQFTKKKTINLDKERKAASEWVMPKIPIQKKAKPNGSRKPRKKKP